MGHLETDGRISRRTFLNGAAAVGMRLVTPDFFWQRQSKAGCENDDTAELPMFFHDINNINLDEVLPRLYKSAQTIGEELVAELSPVGFRANEWQQNMKSVITAYAGYLDGYLAIKDDLPEVEKQLTAAKIVDLGSALWTIDRVRWLYQYRKKELLVSVKAYARNGFRNPQNWFGDMLLGDTIYQLPGLWSNLGSVSKGNNFENMGPVSPSIELISGPRLLPWLAKQESLAIADFMDPVVYSPGINRVTGFMLDLPLKRGIGSLPGYGRDINFPTEGNSPGRPEILSFKNMDEEMQKEVMNILKATGFERAIPRMETGYHDVNLFGAFDTQERVACLNRNVFGEGKYKQYPAFFAQTVVHEGVIHPVEYLISRLPDQKESLKLWAQAHQLIKPVQYFPEMDRVLNPDNGWKMPDATNLPQWEAAARVLSGKWLGDYARRVYLYYGLCGNENVPMGKDLSKMINEFLQRTEYYRSGMSGVTLFRHWSGVSLADKPQINFDFETYLDACIDGADKQTPWEKFIWESILARQKQIGSAGLALDGQIDGTFKQWGGYLSQVVVPVVVADLMYYQTDQVYEKVWLSSDRRTRQRASELEFLIMTMKRQIDYRVEYAQRELLAVVGSAALCRKMPVVKIGDLPADFDLNKVEEYLEAVRESLIASGMARNESSQQYT